MTLDHALLGVVAFIALEPLVRLMTFLLNFGVLRAAKEVFSERAERRRLAGPVEPAASGLTDTQFFVRWVGTGRSRTFKLPAEAISQAIAVPGGRAALLVDGVATPIQYHVDPWNTTLRVDGYIAPGVSVELRSVRTRKLSELLDEYRRRENEIAAAALREPAKPHPISPEPWPRPGKRRIRR